jgi:hypothetical protein
MWLWVQQSFVLFTPSPESPLFAPIKKQVIQETAL